MRLQIFETDLVQTILHFTSFIRAKEIREKDRRLLFYDQMYFKTHIQILITRYKNYIINSQNK